MTPGVIAVAITGSAPRKKDNPAVPTTPAEKHLLDLMLGELRRVLPQATWAAAEIGANQMRVMEWVLARGADGVRTGLEDNVRIDRERLAPSNAALVQLAAEAGARHRRRPAAPAEARALLGAEASP